MSTLIDRQLLSLYVTLMLSVACLGYAELGQQLPETAVFYPLMFLALGFAYWAEGRFSLSILVSNILATVVLLGSLIWLIMNADRSIESLDDMDTIRTLVARTGPILCSLLLAKLFRPKTISDQWLLQLLGLVQVILASVLAMSSRLDRDAPLFPVLMLMYLASLAWAFRLFYIRQQVELLSHSSVSNQKTAEQVQWFSLQPLGWFLLCFLLTVIIFFCLPRGGVEANLMSGADLSETGATSKIDLSAEGTVETSDEKVMRIWARNTDGPVALPEGIRLRGSTLCVYNENSKIWAPFPSSSIIPQQVPTVPPVLQPGVTRMEFDIDVDQVQELGKPRRSRLYAEYTIPLYLADPPVTNRTIARQFSLVPPGRMPTPLNINIFEGLFWLSSSQKVPTVSLTHDYTGKLNATEWVQSIRDLPADYFNYLKILKKIPSRIAETGKIATLSLEVLNKANLTSTSPDKEKALALEKFLASPPYQYSLDRKKQDTQIDPTEDFLLNVKEGHCERYASALTIMLRTIGIPARIVIGYRGAEWNDLGGFFTVRQYHAHAWVEALVGEERLADGTTQLRWQVLDATPFTTARHNDDSFTTPITFARFLWEFFILDFAGQAQRNKLMSQLQNTPLGKFFAWWYSLSNLQAILVLAGMLMVLAGLIWLLVRWRRYRKLKKLNRLNHAEVSIPFYARFLQWAQSQGWNKARHQTPSEFAAVVQHKLQQAKVEDSISQIPASLVPPYYAVRFGGKALNTEDSNTLDDQLNTLQTCLKST